MKMSIELWWNDTGMENRTTFEENLPQQIWQVPTWDRVRASQWGRRLTAWSVITTFHENYFKFCPVLLRQALQSSLWGFLMHRILYRIAPLTWWLNESWTFVRRRGIEVTKKELLGDGTAICYKLHEGKIRPDVGNQLRISTIPL